MSQIPRETVLRAVLPILAGNQPDRGVSGTLDALTELRRIAPGARPLTPSAAGG